ncbi:Eco57I restriction-modification methylase domain-containing protein [uncultured Parolsenella sp.]|uniref:Eco57I restriction-modification methylase domain-containing protein n=1 Tax=uncultured Parolsenella sp. TaxID=2083008 RepID=UPI0025F96641|nr:Eco57I restriction-modification methylase domain-containing protein [uncultured Parolsenella sp.]
MASLLARAYNPDVLSCIANLSNDEVFTPPELANRVLDMLPKELWSDPSVKILDPFCKSGVFLREAAKRLIKGLKDVYPDLQTRVNHIMQSQLYGVATTELTGLLSRRSLYCSKYANGRFSVAEFGNPDGNVRYRECGHAWANGRCKYCGASSKEYKRSLELEAYAYEFIHVNDPRELLNMKFDVVIGNPPYQLSDGGNKASASPIYQLFVQQAEKLNPRYLAMIIPARWYAGGKGLDSFRQSMLSDKHITRLVDFPDSKDCFPGVDIAGGVCYFLRERDRAVPECEVTTMEADVPTIAMRKLDEYPTFIRDSRAISIIDKVKSFGEKTMDKQVSSRKPFGLATNVTPEKAGDLTLRYIGGEGPFPRNEVKSGIDLIDQWKVVASYVSFDHAGRANKDGQRKVLSRMRILPPGTICTETYLVYGAYDSKGEAVNLQRYLSCKLPRYLISQLSSGQHLTKGTFALCPVPDVSVEWDDDSLAKKYSLDEAEVAAVDSAIIPIPFTGGADE